MDQGEASKMVSAGSYPSPNAQHTPGPFFQPGPQEQDHHPRAPTAPMQAEEIDSRHYASGLAQAQIQTPQQLAQQGLNINHDGTPSQNDSGKKKQKVSRACDECRRKKIKCDAVEGDTSKPVCSACARSDTQCQFSRAPQKRGPSKGYIKDLATRVSILESERSVTGFPTDMDTYSPSTDFMTPDSRKRTHSMVEGSHAFDDGPEQLQQLGKNFVPNMGGFPQPDGTGAHQGSLDALRGVHLDADSSLDPIDTYYREMHTHFPILPDSKPGLDLLLNGARNNTKDLLLASVNSVFKTSTDAGDLAPLDLAQRLLMQTANEDARNRPDVDNLVILQASLLVAIAKEVSGPGKNQAIQAYSVAYTIANFLGLYNNEEPDARESKEVYARKVHGRRAWLVLAALDRWHATSMVVPFQVSEERVWLHQSDRKILGAIAYDLIRLSLSLGHIADTLLVQNPQFSDPNLPPFTVSRLLYGQLDRFRESVDMSSPALRHIQLLYLHSKLLADRHLLRPELQTKRIVKEAFSIIHLLSNDQNRASPLTHHVAALAALTLGEILDRDPLPISNALKALRNGLDKGTVQYPQGDSNKRPAWSAAISRFISTRLQTLSNGDDRGGLQHLADAAVGANLDTAGDEAAKKLDGEIVDWSAMTKEGYLRLFE